MYTILDLIEREDDGNNWFDVADETYSILKRRDGKCLVYRQNENDPKVYDWSEIYHDDLDECLKYINK